MSITGVQLDLSVNKAITSQPFVYVDKKLYQNMIELCNADDYLNLNSDAWGAREGEIQRHSGLDGWPGEVTLSSVR